METGATPPETPTANMSTSGKHVKQVPLDKKLDEKTSLVPRLELILESKLESANRAESLLRQFSSEMGYGHDQQEQIALAVREAVVNAVFHGNRCNPEKKVVLRAELRDSALRISICDEGKGFNLDSLPDPLHSSNLFNASGRGVRLMKCLMDEVDFRGKTSGTEVTMIKFLGNIGERGN